MLPTTELPMPFNSLRFKYTLKNEEVFKQLMKTFAFEKVDIISRVEFSGFTPQMNTSSITKLDFNQYSNPIHY